jgi:hypothetical protein
MSQELTAAATAAVQTWYLFFAAPEFRPYALEANEKMLDAELTRQGFSLTVNNLRCIFPEIEPQLARIAPRVQPQAAPTVEPVALELPADQLPANMTFKYIQDLDKHTLHKLRKEYVHGIAIFDRALENRMNGIN